MAGIGRILFALCHRPSSIHSMPDSQTFLSFLTRPDATEPQVTNDFALRYFLLSVVEAAQVSKRPCRRGSWTNLNLLQPYPHRNSWPACIFWPELTLFELQASPAARRAELIGAELPAEAVLSDAGIAAGISAAAAVQIGLCRIVALQFAILFIYESTLQQIR
jgi:hypothetical protein